MSKAKTSAAAKTVAVLETALKTAGANPTNAKALLNSAAKQGSTAALLEAVVSPVQAVTTAKVPASMAVLASITATPTVAAGTLPGKWATFAGYTVTITAKGQAAKRLQERMADNAKHGACPFALALFKGQGKTLGEAWKDVTASGHGQQGRGNGGYTAADALGYYTKATQWFALVAPSK
jgi:hypothetical protein